MLTALLAVTLAAGTSISGAHASVANGRMTLTVDASLPLPPESAHGRIDGHALRLVISGVALNDERRDFGGGDLPVHASPGADSVVLDLAVPAACTGDVHLEAAPAGLRAEVACPPPPPLEALHVAALPTPMPSLDTLTGSSASGAITSSPASGASTAEAPHAPVAAAVLLVALAAAALFWTRRTAMPGGHLRLEQSTSLGPRRALVVARLGEELLVLGSSESGIQLLATRPAPASQPAAAKVSLFEQLGIGTRKNGASFEDLLREGTEDELLRRKLEAGMAGRVR